MTGRKGGFLRFLGSGDSQGVPRWWCDCSVCQEAKGPGHNARTRPSALIETKQARILLDAAPELRLQMSREGVDGVEAVLISHAHNDHILGLSDVGDMARWTKRPIPIYAVAEVIDALKERFAYMTRGSYRPLTPFNPLTSSTTLAGYRVEVHKVPHGANGWAYGFRFEAEGSSWAYIPDSIGIRDLAPWRGLELLVLGTSFYKERADVASRSVYDVEEATALVAELEPGRTVFTHLGHGVDTRKPAPSGTSYARDGLIIELPC